MIGPFLWMVGTSLKTDRDISRDPAHGCCPTRDGTNYGAVTDAFPFWRFMLATASASR